MTTRPHCSKSPPTGTGRRPMPESTTASWRIGCAAPGITGYLVTVITSSRPEHEEREGTVVHSVGGTHRAGRADNGCCSHPFPGRAGAIVPLHPEPDCARGAARKRGSDVRLHNRQHDKRVWVGRLRQDDEISPRPEWLCRRPAMDEDNYGVFKADSRQFEMKMPPHPPPPPTRTWLSRTAVGDREHLGRRSTFSACC